MALSLGYDAAMDAEPAPVPTLNEIQEEDWLLDITGRRAGFDAFFLCMIGTVLSGAGAGTAIAAFGGIGTMALAVVLTLLMLSLAYGMVLGFGAPCAPGEHSLAGAVRQRRARRLIRRRERARRLDLADLDARDGWRPRTGAHMPAGRTDTHDRYRVVADEVRDQIGLCIQRWVYDEQQGWTIGSFDSQCRSELTRLVDATDEQAIDEARAALDRYALILAAEARALEEAAEVERLERRRLIERINAEPSA